MALKCFFITSFLTISCVNSYVLFAANIDDFRNLAKKVMPGQLGEQLAKRAAKREGLNYDNTNIEDGDDEDSTSDSDYSSGDRNYSYDASYQPANPVSKEKRKPLKKKYLIYNESISLDQLVEKVKEKLEQHYKMSLDVKKQSNNNINIESSTSGHEVKIEDYYYKDDNMNGYFNKDTENHDKMPTQATYTAGIIKYDVASQHDEESTEYFEGLTAEPDFAESDLKDIAKHLEYGKEIIINDRKKQLAKQKYIIRYGDGGQEVQKTEEYGNKIPKRASKNIKTVDKKGPFDVQRYSIESIEGRPVNNKNENNEDENIQPNVKEIPEYYDDNAKDVPIEPKNYADIFKEVNMLKSNNDSYEDYVIPKPDNIFESDESLPKSKTVNPIPGVHKTIRNKKLKSGESEPKGKGNIERVNINNDVVTPPTKRVTFTAKTPLIRAKTAKMWYKDPNIANYDESKKKIQENSVKRTTNKQLRTMFPTKQHVKISSPNYFAKLPVVAEKYNFDEPIPENDREPELIKHIGNPPAMINKKVRL